MSNFLGGVYHYTVQPNDSYLQVAQRFNTTVEHLMAANPSVDPYHLFIGQNIRIPTLNPNPMPAFPNTSKCVSQAEVDLKSNSRLLWQEHIAWTRMTIISITFHLPDLSFVTMRLLRNATDMGNSIKPCYGDEIGDEYAQLIKDHLLLAAELVKAAVAGDQRAVADANKKWYANADDIAAFWHRVNPYLTVEAVKKMFYEHLDLTKLEAVCMINMDYQADIEVYDKIEREALEMSDALMDAVVKQFPEMFICQCGCACGDARSG